jgi:transcription antitermination factor NusG
MKKVEEPLFKSYVFVRVSEAERTAVRMTPGVVNFVYWLGKPAVIRDHEIAIIRQFLDEHEEVEALRTEDIQPGSRLIITSGVMMDQQATALKVGKRYVEVVIESIGYTLRAKLERTKLKRIG